MPCRLKRNAYCTYTPLRYIDPSGWAMKPGNTGHEHLPAFGLINMNGRMYDPVIGRSGQVLTLPIYMAFLLTEY